MPDSSDIIFDTLERWGVDTIYGLPGDGINGLMESLRTRQDRLRFVLVHHEEAAAFAAVAHAKFTGRLGACIATTGPGGIHLLNGLYDAKLDNAPVIAITGTTYTDLEGSSYQQDVDMTRIMDDVATYNMRVNSPEHARLVTDLACRNALATTQPAHITVPIDVQEEELQGEYTKHRQGTQTSEAPVRVATVPPTRDLERAAAVIDGSERPVILAGSGARGGARELLAFAERIQAPVVKALLGKDIVPDDHPLTLGGLGLLGTKPSSVAMEGADLLVMVGTSFPYAEFLPDGEHVPGIQIDVNPTRIGLRYPVEVGLVGDARETLAALAPHVRTKQPTPWLRGLQDQMGDWWRLLENRATRSDSPLKPQMVAWELGKRLRDDAIICADSGSNTTWVARYVKIRGDQRFSLSGTLASMASGLPYAVAAQTAYPDRQVVVFQGDGGFQMLMGELGTIQMHDLPVKVVIMQNDMLAQIRWEQMVFLGRPSFGIRFAPADYARIAEGFGIRGFTLERAQDVGHTLDDFLAVDGPAVLAAKVDPNEPPHPPQVSLDQARHMAEALARGEPNATRVGMTLFRDKVKDLFAELETREEEPEREARSELRRS